MSERTFYERVERTAGGFKYIRLKSGRLISFWDAIEAARTAHTDLGRAVSRALKLVNDEDWGGDWDLERIEWFLDHLETHIGAIRQTIEKRRGVKSQEERIAMLRKTEGRTPEEAEAFLRKADQLERQLP